MNQNQDPASMGETLSDTSLCLQSEDMQETRPRKSQPTFYSDFQKGVSGIIKHKEKIPRNTFAMKLKILVEAEECTGYYAEVVRELDKKQRVCFFNVESLNNKMKFMSQLNYSFGSGGMTCGLDTSQLIEFFQHLQRSIPEPLPVKRAILYTGMQPDGSCVLNEDTFISPNGELMNPSESPYIWLDKDFIFDTDKIKSVDISPPKVVLPLTITPLSELIETLKIISKHNVVPALYVVAGAIIAFHYSAIKNMFGGCPMVVAIGESETGKSTAIRAALSLFGCDQISRYVKGTNALFMERASRSTLPFGIEEAVPSKKGKTNKLDLTELVIDLFDGAVSANMKTGTLKPKSVPILATNFDVEDIDRLKTRILVVPFSLPSTGPISTEEDEAYEQFEKNLLNHFYTSTSGWIVSLRNVLLKEGKNDIQQKKLQLQESGMKIRNATGWAVALFFLEKILTATEKPELLEEVNEFTSEMCSISGKKEALISSSSASLSDLVINFCKKLVSVVTKMDLNERLKFMRTGTEVLKREVLAVWLKGCPPEVIEDFDKFIYAVKKTQMGKAEKRDFLNTSSKDMYITQGVNNIRRSCTVIYLDTLPEELTAELKEVTQQKKIRNTANDENDSIMVQECSGESSFDNNDDMVVYRSIDGSLAERDHDLDYEIQNIEGDSSIEVSTQNSSDELLETSSKAKRQQKRKSNLTKEKGTKAKKLRGNYKAPNFSKNLCIGSNIYD